MASRTKTETAPERKTYKKPLLTKYGQLKDLTTGGSGSANEGSPGGSAKRP
jgi:hypothetical protein